MICKPEVLAGLLACALLLSGCDTDHTASKRTPSGGAQFVRLLDEADAAMAGGALPQAGQLLDRAMALEPDNPDLWVAIARLRFRGGEHLTALEAADRALELDHDHAPALLMRALMVRDAHGLADALPWFEAALAADDSNVDAWAEYAATLGDFGRNREMLAAVRQLAKIAPGEPRVFYLQAVLAQRGGKPVLARSLLQRSGMAERGVPAAVLLDALISLDQGNFASAAAQLEALVARQPANRRIRALLARALLLDGRETEVIARFGAEADEAEASPYLLMLVARAHERLGDRASAAPLLARAYAVASGTPVVLAARDGLPPPTAELRRIVLAGKVAQARVSAQGLRVRFPASADIAQLAGDAALASGDPRGALENYAHAARVRRPWPLTRKAAFAYRSAGDANAAETLLTRHVAGEPDNPAALTMLAQTLAVRGEWKRVELLLDHAIALGAGHDPALLALRALAAREGGKIAAAARFAALRAELRPPALTAH
ncbi:tetratricopeptide repeat protein [Erythrobacter tepidarius]|uniref:tetratricopeptide repeat protein n=1 Tax=Erythrobacter tepidarius TaxID=60454 RepID=UPI000A3A3DC2|nr:tetratricopeptide repeat protein [Erythrobacter tepidarius]